MLSLKPKRFHCTMNATWMEDSDVTSASAGPSKFFQVVSVKSKIP